MINKLKVDMYFNRRRL